MGHEEVKPDKRRCAFSPAFFVAINKVEKEVYMHLDGMDFYVEGTQVVLHTGGMVCSTQWEVVNSEMFETVVDMYVKSLQEKESPLIDSLRLREWSSVGRRGLLGLLRSLSENTFDTIEKFHVNQDGSPHDRAALHEFVEGLYDFWRLFDRFIICHSIEGRFSHDHRPYRTFNMTIERLAHLVRGVYRDICENITGDHPRVYRQVSAGFDIGVIAVEKKWESPESYGDLFDNIPFIRQVLMKPPFIIDPPMNKRTGEFRKVDENPLRGMKLEKSHWICYPAKVGPLVIFIYVHQHFIGLGCSLANLFEIASDEEILKGPDAVYFFGAPVEAMEKYGDIPTVFYDDEENKILVAAAPLSDFFGYFGYLKKMTLTLHNIVMMKKGRMPYHGAMARITLKTGAAATILLIGDTATGKSETLEAFRILGRDIIRDIRIIADDMGSLEISSDSEVLGYGTEIGAFIRLDDLEHGYAFAHVDRAIIMSPHKTNARVVLPVTTLAETLKGYEIDIILYANNYEQVNEELPIIDRFENVERALSVFSEGKAMSKGTTTSNGLVRTYFANIFGPSQYQDIHEEIAEATFTAAEKSGVFIGQLRTQLGISGFESTGPHAAAKALFDLISERSGTN